jgi:beta-glucosidase-like glycosyl hydrolase
MQNVNTGSLQNSSGTKRTKSQKILRSFLILFFSFLISAIGWFAYSSINTYLLKVYIIEKVDEIYTKLTWKERIGQLFMIALPGNKFNPQMERELLKIQPGGVIYFHYNFLYPYLKDGTKYEKYNLGLTDEQVKRSIKSLKTLNSEIQEFSMGNFKVPLLITTDQEGGRVYRIGAGVTHFPGAMAIGQMDVPEFSYNAAFINGLQLKELGINMVLAPVLDINNNPFNPVINIRSFGTSLNRVIRMAVPYLKGLSESGNIGVIKHFPGHGDTDKDSHITVPVIRKSISELHQLELVPFKKAIAEGTQVIMTAHILLPKIDPLNVATMSPVFLKDILREEMKFSGIIISDALEMEGVAKRNPGKNLGIKALKAGVDILLFTSWGKKVWEIHEHIINEFKTERLNPELVELSVKRILTLKLKKGLFHSNYSHLVRFDDRMGDHLENTNKVIKNRLINIIRPLKKINSVIDLKNNSLADKFLKSSNKQSDIKNGYFPSLNNISKQDRGAFYDWNHLISYYSVRGIYQPVLGTPLDIDKTVFFYKSVHLKNLALFSGIRNENLYPFSAFPSLIIKKGKLKKTLEQNYLVEMHDPADIKIWNMIWNKLIKHQKYKYTRNIIHNTNGPVYALYAGNPFLKIFIPLNGGVAATFSPSKVSLEEGWKRFFLMYDLSKIEYFKDSNVNRNIMGLIPSANLILR